MRSPGPQTAGSSPGSIGLLTAGQDSPDGNGSPSRFSVLQRASSADRLGLSIQCWNIVPKIREVDGWIDPERQERVREVHPELAFRALADEGTVIPSKKTAPGRNLRRALLASVGFENLVEEWLRIKVRGAAEDDLLDGCAAAWSARRIGTGHAESFPEGAPPRDSRGLEMTISC